MPKSLHRLFANDGGQVTVLFALVAVPLFLAAGMAIDRIGADNARTELQAAVDGAGLAAALADVNETQRKKIARDYFDSNFRLMSNSEANFSVSTSADKITVSAQVDYPTSFMRLAGIDYSRLTASVDVQLASGGNAEVALVLDYSGSMTGNNKVGRMANAATNMVQELTAKSKPGQIKFGVVPFSAMVRTSMPAKYVLQKSATETWTGCTQDRGSPYNLTVDTPTFDDKTKWGYYDIGNQNKGDYACPQYAGKQLDILPLTADSQVVIDKLKVMKPLGYTNIPLGAEFGWNLLDPQEPFPEAAPYTDEKTKKYLILLTDGV
jgi:Flp pilus assembly protein TadG